MQIQIVEIKQDSELTSQINIWSCGLWWSDFAEACIERCFVALDGEAPVGFQTVNTDGLCVAIEVHPRHQGKGVASLMVEESGCWRPDRNENSDFWAAMAEKFGY